MSTNFYIFRNPLPSDFFVVRRARHFWIQISFGKHSYYQCNLCSLILRAQTIPKKSERDLWRKHTCLCPQIFFALPNSFWALKSCFLWREKEDPNSKQCSQRDRKVATRIFGWSIQFTWVPTHRKTRSGLGYLFRYSLCTCEFWSEVGYIFLKKSV